MFKKNLLLFLTILLFSVVVFGEKTFEAEDNNPKTVTNTPKRRVVADFDGDGKTDLSIYRFTDGNWHVWRSSDNIHQVTYFGGGTRDKFVPGDFDGDSKADFVIRRGPVWYILNSSDATIRYEWFGIESDHQVTGDYDGDGKDDLALYRHDDDTWYFLRSSDRLIYQIQFGNGSPVPADYDGDGKTDIAIHRPSDDPSETDFYILRSSDSSVAMISWGIGNYRDRAVTGDYDGDGKADIAVYRETVDNWYIGNWYILKSSGGYSVEQFGHPCAQPVSGDYDGDGKDDIAYYNNCEGNWYIKNSSTNTIRVQKFGLTNDALVPFLRYP